jgi:hypothetical protein
MLFWGPVVKGPCPVAAACLRICGLELHGENNTGSFGSWIGIVPLISSSKFSKSTGKKSYSSLCSSLVSKFSKGTDKKSSSSLCSSLMSSVVFGWGFGVGGGSAGGGGLCLLRMMEDELDRCGDLARFLV